MQIYTDNKIWEEIVKNLKNNNLTISTMESCTGGGIANEITNISGASSIIRESFITYCNEAKIAQGVSPEIIKKYTVYSEQTAIEMAKAVKRKTNSNISVGVTGLLGRIDPSNPIDKLNHVWYAIIDQNDNISVNETIVSDNERSKQKAEIINKIAVSILNKIK